MFEVPVEWVPPEGERVEVLLKRLRGYSPLLGNVPIAGVTGANGGGKSLVLVAEALFDLAHGRDVWSTVDVVLGDLRSRRIESLSQLLAVHNATVVLDEIATILPSGSAQSLPAEIRVLVQAARHRNVTLRWSAPAWGRAVIDLRQVTQAVVNVQPMGRRNVFKRAELWPEPLCSFVRVWDTIGVKLDSTPDKILRRRLLRLRACPSWGAYDTHADVPFVGFPDSSGVCIDCGGSRTRPKCSDDRHGLLGLSLPYSLERDAPRAPHVDDIGESTSPVAGHALPESLAIAGGVERTAGDR